MDNTLQLKKEKTRQTRKILSARNFQLQCETAPKVSLDKIPLTEESLKLSWKNGYDAGYRAALQAYADKQSCTDKQS